LAILSHYGLCSLVRSHAYLSPLTIRIQGASSFPQHTQ
jgi:hypothetical protein